MAEHILFLTGTLAEKQLRQTLEAMAPEFRYTVQPLGLKVAALMTADMIRRRLKDSPAHAVRQQAHSDIARAMPVP